MNKLGGMLLLGAALAACNQPDPGWDGSFPVAGGGGKTDVFGRKLAGVASPYPADIMLDDAAMRSDHRRRRDSAWATAFKVLEQVPLLGLAESPGAMLPESGVPRVPRFQTWYGIEDIKRMFQHLYEELQPQGRAARRPFSAAELTLAEQWNASALDRSDRWSLERYFEHVARLGQCPPGTTPDECARLVQSNFSGAAAGNPRILYSPATVRHLLANYGRVTACLAELERTPADAKPSDESNFTLCFESEFPKDAVLVKSQWVRADIGQPFAMFDTDALSLSQRLSGSAEWNETGDRHGEPAADRIYTIRLRDGSVFRLAGLHIMTKELRHWQWVSMWWSDRPGEDFGSDRPARFAELGQVWSNYKLCAASGFDEQDADAAGRYADLPSLQAALRASGQELGKPSWCSNPYLEHGRGNARTNCVGCHQHAGSNVDLPALIASENRKQVRQLFPADYLYSYNRVDDFSHMFQSEIGYFDGVDLHAVRARIDGILTRTGDAAAGATRFSGPCAGCHGPEGRGSSQAPSLYERVPQRDDVSILRTLIQGKGGMPRWGATFDDQALADLLAHLRATFGRP